MTTQEILQKCTVYGFVIKLPDITLERNEYLEVKKALELIGGKWKGGKTQGFVYEENPKELLENIANGEKRNLKKEYQFFPTPADIAKLMVKDCLPLVVDYTYKILEPSAGSGSLIKALVDIHPAVEKVDCYELMELNRIKLEKIPSANIIGDDFMQCDKNDYYDIVLANPPFTKNQDIDHIGKMWQVVKPGGIIATLASTSWIRGSQKKQGIFCNWLEGLQVPIIHLPEGSFKESGTMIAPVMLVIKKPLAYDPFPIELPPMKIERIIETPQTLINDAKKFVENHPQLKERTCRICGCTDNDCIQCIAKTGEPCYWVESDLCSACKIPETEEILKELVKNQKEVDKSLQELQKMISSHKTVNMEFFSKLAEMESVDLSIRIMKKNDKLTLNIMPGSGNATTKPVLVTGTGAELDEGFFTMLMPKYNEISGLLTNVDEVAKEVKEKAEKKKPEEKKSEKPVEAKPNPKQSEPDLFGAVAVPVAAAAPTSEEVKEEEPEEESNE